MAAEPTYRLAKSRDSDPENTYYVSSLPSEDRPMFTRLRRILGSMLGNAFYWIGWALAAVVLVQAIIMSLATGSPFIPVMLGVVGVILWLLGIGLKYMLAGRQVSR